MINWYFRNKEKTTPLRRSPIGYSLESTLASKISRLSSIERSSLSKQEIMYVLRVALDLDDSLQFGEHTGQQEILHGTLELVDKFTVWRARSQARGRAYPAWSSLARRGSVGWPCRGAR